MAVQQDPDFTGKVLLVRIGEGVHSEWFITNARFEFQAGRLFLVGTIADPYPGQPWHGVPTAIAWDSVVRYVVLDSVEEYNRRQAASKDQ
jgi:hypothetical protein